MVKIMLFSHLCPTEDTSLENVADTQSFLPVMFFVHFFSTPQEKSLHTKDSVIEAISAPFLSFFFNIIAGFSRSQRRFPISISFPLSLPSFTRCSNTHKETDAYKHTQKWHTLKCGCGKWRCADCPLRQLHYPFCVYFSFSALIFSLSSALSLCLCSHSLCQVCVRLFPILIVLSLVILSPVPHLSAIIKDPVASYVAPVERRVCISATHLATAPRNYGL